MAYWESGYRWVSICVQHSHILRLIDLTQMWFENRIHPLKGCVEWDDRDKLQSPEAISQDTGLIIVELYGVYISDLSFLYASQTYLYE